MPHSFSLIRSWSNSGDKKPPPTPGPQPEHFRRSEVVRDALVLLALAGSNVALPNDLKQALPLALEKVSLGVKSGMICLDYVPSAARVVDIPVVSHPLYMQALIFWAARLDCTLERLVEAHARLGASPSVVNVSMVLAQIEREDAVPGTHFGSTMSAYHGQATRPTFANTHTHGPGV